MYFFSSFFFFFSVFPLSPRFSFEEGSGGGGQARKGGFNCICGDSPGFRVACYDRGRRYCMPQPSLVSNVFSNSHPRSVGWKLETKTKLIVWRSIPVQYLAAGLERYRKKDGVLGLDVFALLRLSVQQLAATLDASATRDVLFGLEVFALRRSNNMLLLMMTRLTSRALVRVLAPSKFVPMKCAWWFSWCKGDDTIWVWMLFSPLLQNIMVCLLLMRLPSCCSCWWGCSPLLPSSLDATHRWVCSTCRIKYGNIGNCGKGYRSIHSAW